MCQTSVNLSVKIVSKIENFSDLPIIRSAAVKCDVGGPAKPVAPSAAPPKAHATPPNATTAMTARNGGPANHSPQQSFPERSDDDLLIEETKKILTFNYYSIQYKSII